MMPMVIVVAEKYLNVAFPMILAPVEVAVQFLEMKVLQGKNAMLNCRARGIPAPTIKWASGEDGALPLPTNSRMKITPQSSLLIEATNISDSGTYYCIASNVMESKSRFVEILAISCLFTEVITFGGRFGEGMLNSNRFFAD